MRSGGQESMEPVQMPPMDFLLTGTNYSCGKQHISTMLHADRIKFWWLNGMNKPRCPYCNVALKKLYERQGGKAAFKSVDDGWICRNCRLIFKKKLHEEVSV